MNSPERAKYIAGQQEKIGVKDFVLSGLGACLAAGKSGGFSKSQRRGVVLVYAALSGQKAEYYFSDLIKSNLLGIRYCDEP